VIDWKLDIQQAVSLPSFGSRNRGTEIEKGTQLEALVPQLGTRPWARGHASGLHGSR
jgi:hypothetical protein